MVLAKSGAAGSWMIAPISAVWSAKACSNAGRKCSGLISANGGVSNGVCHACTSGFSRACAMIAVSRVSAITISRFRRNSRGESYIMGWGFFAPFALDRSALFGEIAAPKQDPNMSSKPSSTTGRQIIWPSVITVISAAILIGAEVFGAAFAGGWALAILLGLGDQGAHILQAVLFALGVFIMATFIRAAQRVEPFTRRA